ncbi:hypothetical protein ACM64Y_04905 [Novispirillum sp. DQ9]|uniref:hypothetical protein n=1 Tax=Novispirillum sp. DQ9 TaxID=3398612 RepID=UPI003C7E4F0A
MMTTASSPLAMPPVLRGARLGADPERFLTNEEPRLDDILEDPITVRLMASDGLQGDAVRALVRDARARLGEGR